MLYACYLIMSRLAAATQFTWELFVTNPLSVSALAIWHESRLAVASMNTESNIRHDGIGVSIGQLDGLQQVRG
jgi:hypothetical protein